MTRVRTELLQKLRFPVALLAVKTSAEGAHFLLRVDLVLHITQNGNDRVEVV